MPETPSNINPWATGRTEELRWESLSPVGGPAVVGTDVVGDAVVGALVVGPLVVGTDVVGACVVGTDVVGDAVLGSAVVGADVPGVLTLHKKYDRNPVQFDCP